MSNTKIFILAIFLVIAIVTSFAVGSNRQTDSASMDMNQPALASADEQQTTTHPKTTTTTLPNRTNNAWEMDPFQLKGLDGETHTLSDWKGKVIVMNFWASWCGPCQIEIPEFVQYQAAYADRGLQVIGIGVDEERKLSNVKRTLGINYPVLVLDPMASTRLMKKWGNNSGIIPYTVVINSEGRIKYIHRGQMGSAEFDEYVLPLL